MADYLRRHDLAALWYHPAEDVQTVFVAYASSSTSWGFLDNNRSFPPNASLRIVARSYLPPVSTVHQNMPAPAAEPVELPVTSAINPAVVSAEEAKGDGSTREEYEDPPYIPLFPPTPLPTNVEDKDLVNVFRERWDITFEELSRVNNPQDDNVARTFFLYFPSEVEDEFQLVLRFLKKHPGTIFTNRVEGDWGRFVESPKNGTVIVSIRAYFIYQNSLLTLILPLQSHQSYDLFDQMPNFQKVIRKPSNIFLVDLVRAIDFLDYKIHLQRLFPHGCVILMTEDFMLREPEAAVRVMRWFLDYLPVKFPGTWKIFFRPNIVGWLIDAFDTWPDDTSVSHPHFAIQLYWCTGKVV